MSSTQPNLPLSLDLTRNERLCARAGCQEPFTPKNARTAQNQRYCSSRCRALAHARRMEDVQLTHELEARSEGQAKARERYREVADIAAREMVRYLGVHGTAIVSDIRVACEQRGITLPWGKNWVGGMLQHHAWFEPTGDVRRAHHPGSRGRMVRVYRLSAEGRQALVELENPERRGGKR